MNCLEHFASLIPRSLPVSGLLSLAVACSSGGSPGVGAGGVPGAAAAGADGGSIGASGAVGTAGSGTAGSAGASNAGSGGVWTGGSSGGPSGGSVGSTAGGTATGGVSASSSGGAGNGDPFVLAWQDDFDALDSSKWELESFTWNGNQAQFTPANATTASGILTVALTNAPAGSAKPYLGVEMRSLKTLKYGKISTRMRFAAGSGVVSGLVTFYTPYPNCDWNEIDIEHLGSSSGTSQMNAMVYTGAPQPDCTVSVTPTADPLIANLGFNAETDFHVYDIEWTPAGVSYFVDRVLLRTWSKSIDLLKLPQNILITIWASNAASWAGALTPDSAPTSAQVDWIKVYDWQG